MNFAVSEGQAGRLQDSNLRKLLFYSILALLVHFVAFLFGTERNMLHSVSLCCVPFRCVLIHCCSFCSVPFNSVAFAFVPLRFVSFN